MTINIIAVIVAAIASMVVGFVWYTVLFQKPWMKLSGTKMDPKDKEAMAAANMGYALTFVGSLVMSFVFAVFANMTNTTGLANGAILGAVAWVGFTFPPMMATYFFGKRPTMLLLIDSGNFLATMVVVGAIIGMWR